MLLKEHRAPFFCYIVIDKILQNITKSVQVVQEVIFVKIIMLQCKRIYMRSVSGGDLIDSYNDM